MSYELVPLGDLGEIVTGSTPDTTNKDYWDGNIPWITPADLTNHEGIYFTGNLRKITEAGYKSCSTKMIPAGSIVYSTRAPIGHCAVTSFPLCTNQGFKSIVPNERLDAVYGFFALKYFTPQLEALGRGATFAEVNKETFENFRIPLPPLEEQKRIASLLARADRLRQLRRAARQLTDSLLQSVFLEMFGDGFGKWKVDLLENLTDKIDYGVTASAVLKPVGPKFLRITDIQEGKVNWDDVPYCEISEKERNASLLSKGDIVFARTGATTGKSFLIQECPENSVFASYLIRVRPAKELNPVFLFGYFQTAQYWKQISESATGSTQPGVNSTKLGELKIPLPPLPLQEEFARVAARVEGLRARQAEAERQAEGLFQSLLALSFAEGLAQSFGE